MFRDLGSRGITYNSDNFHFVFRAVWARYLGQVDRASLKTPTLALSM